MNKCTFFLVDFFFCGSYAILLKIKDLDVLFEYNLVFLMYREVEKNTWVVAKMLRITENMERSVEKNKNKSIRIMKISKSTKEAV